jgi:cytochrome oxidase Cu insertion factor (SCO1/SenC/PrrC family)
MQRIFSGKVGVLVLGLALTAMSCASAQQPAAMKIRAPELQGIDEWINSKPLSLKALKGKVVVVHFWTFG